MIFKDFVWSKFSSYYHRNDNYKNNQGEGLLQRFLSIFGLELDEILIPAIEQFINNLDPQTATTELLSELAYSVGKPSDIDENLAHYRNLILQIISIYKVKGTFRSYQYLFKIFGYSVEIEELFRPDNNYDIGLKYDDGVSYDDDPCSRNCVHYKLTYSIIPGVGIEPDENFSDLMIGLIKELIEPHSAVLDSLEYIELED